jgi:hypothetical protein
MWGGGGFVVWPSDRQIDTCRKVSLKVNIIRWRHFALLLWVFLRGGQSMLTYERLHWITQRHLNYICFYQEKSLALIFANHFSGNVVHYPERWAKSPATVPLNTSFLAAALFIHRSAALIWNVGRYNYPAGHLVSYLTLYRIQHCILTNYRPGHSSSGLGELILGPRGEEGWVTETCEAWAC